MYLQSYGRIVWMEEQSELWGLNFALLILLIESCVYPPSSSSQVKRISTEISIGTLLLYNLAKSKPSEVIFPRISCAFNITSDKLMFKTRKDD